MTLDLPEMAEKALLENVYTSHEQRSYAARVVASFAADAPDAAVLLAMLGLEVADGVRWARRGSPTYGVRVRTKTAKKTKRGG